MTDKEKIQLLQAKPPSLGCLVDYYQNMLRSFGDLKRNYYDYMITEPLDCDEELKRIETADYDLCCALLTMLFREDHFVQYGCFGRRCENGDVQKITNRMILILEKEDKNYGLPKRSSIGRTTY